MPCDQQTAYQSTYQRFDVNFSRDCGHRALFSGVCCMRDKPRQKKKLQLHSMDVSSTVTGYDISVHESSVAASIDICIKRGREVA